MIESFLLATTSSEMCIFNLCGIEKGNRKVKFVSQITALINWSFDIDIEDEGALVEVEKLVCNP